MLTNTKKIWCISLIFLGLCLSSFQTLAVKNWTITSFKYLEARDYVNVEIRESQELKIEVVGSDLFKEYLKVDQSGDRLILSTTKKKLRRNESYGKSLVIIYTPSFKSIKTDGIGNVNIPGPFDFGDNFTIKSNGTGDIQGNVKANNFTASISGTGDCDMAIFCGDLQLKQNGTGDVDMKLKCSTYDFQFNGTGDHVLKIEEAVKGSIKNNGTGDVDGVMDVKDLFCKNSGTGNLSLNITSDKFELKQSGTCDAHLTGKTKKSYITSSMGNVKAKELTSDVSFVKVTGTGDVYVNASIKLNAILSSYGSLYYLGDPIIEHVCSSKGMIKRL
ncbi:DUF2807 domain-containing protein [Halosquirtibacter xylanolyticus]|uniref:GIN domain-containing protein n=1 Tax=Halosquirtibacter xylanolyticus TaxID=3374599 RepID=UPI00374A16EE|nr:DUF2807 domain-containing protein [Prolixibacteraceae bacterium]